MRKPVQYINGEYYHVFNRGNDKRIVFKTRRDLKRFLQDLSVFNTVSPIESIYKQKRSPVAQARVVDKSPLVNIIAYCLMPNHFHLILEQVHEGGISEFMKRLGGGYTLYFNEQHKRSGVLFQGKYKAIHIATTPYFLHLSAYVNLNYVGHGRTLSVKSAIAQGICSSYDDYISEPKAKKENELRSGPSVNTQAVLRHFKNKAAYKKYAEETIDMIRARKLELQDFPH